MRVRLFPLVMATFAVGTDNFVIAGLLPAISTDLGVTVTAAGQLVTVFALTFAVSASVLGAAFSGLDRRTALLIALAIFTCGNVITAIGATYGWVMAGRLIAAVGAGTITSSASAIAAAVAAPERRAWAMSIVLGGMSAATAIGLPLGTLIGTATWRLTLWVIVALSVVTMAGVVLWIPPVSLPGTSIGERLAPLRQPWVVVVLVTTVLIFASTYAVYTYIAPALHPVTGGSVRTLTTLLLVFGLGTVAGTLMSGRLSDRYTPERVLVGNLILMVMVLAAGPVATAALPSAIVWIAVWGVCAAASTVPQQHRLVHRHVAAMPVLLGLNSSAIYLGISLGGASGGTVLRWVPADRLYLPAGALAALALATVVLSVRRTPGRAAVPRAGSPGRRLLDLLRHGSQMP